MQFRWTGTARQFRRAYGYYATSNGLSLDVLQGRVGEQRVQFLHLLFRALFHPALGHSRVTPLRKGHSRC